MWLKLKIFFGYVILILLLAFIVYQFRQEQGVRHMLRKEEKELAVIHRLAIKNYISLLELSTYAEIAITWDNDDLKKYRRKRHEICDGLQLLKKHIHYRKATLTHCAFFFGIKKSFFLRQYMLSMNCWI